MSKLRKRSSGFKFLKSMEFIFSILIIIDSIVHLVSALRDLNDNQNNTYITIIMCIRIVMAVIDMIVVYFESSIKTIILFITRALFAIFMTIFLFVSPILIDFSLNSISLIAQIIATYLSLAVVFKLIVVKLCDKADEDLSDSSNQTLAMSENSLNESKISFGNKKKTFTLKKLFLAIDDNLLAFATLMTVIIAITLGVVVKDTSFEWNKRSLMYIGFIGEIFLRILKSLVLPLIFSSIVFAMSNIETKLLGKIGLRVFLYYFTTTVLATTLSVILVLVIVPGKRSRGVSEPISSSLSSQSVTEDNALDLIRNLFPDNLIEACFQSYQTILIPPKNQTIDNNTDIYEWDMKSSSSSGINILGIVMFAVVLGIIIGQMNESEGQILKDFFKSFTNAIMRITAIVIQITPIAVLFLVLSQVLSVENIQQLIESVGWYALTVIFGILIHGLVVLPALYLMLTRNNPYKFLLRMSAAILTAFGTSSSAATMPVTIQCLEEKNQIDKRIVRFSIPLGSTINMDGAAMYEAVAAIFIAQHRGIELSIVQVLIIAITATAVSVGIAGIPQGGAIMVVIVLNSVGLPIEDAALVYVVDWLLDRFCTALNIIGDAFGAGLVYHYSKDDLQSFDKQVFSLS